MQTNPITFLKSNYYTNSSLENKRVIGEKETIDIKAQYILSNGELYKVEPKLSKWKITLSVVMPLIPIALFLNALYKIGRIIELKNETEQADRSNFFTNLLKRQNDPDARNPLHCPLSPESKRLRQETLHLLENVPVRGNRITIDLLKEVVSAAR